MSRPYVAASRDLSVKKLGFLTKENFHQLLSENKYTIVLFYDEYCADCIAVDSILTEIKNEVTDLGVKKINFEENSEIAEYLNIIKAPTILLYKNGIQYWRNVGLVSKDHLKKQVF